MSDAFIHGNESSGSSLSWGFLDYPSDYCLKRNSSILTLFLDKYQD
jgi:hypothetical protein